MGIIDMFRSWRHQGVSVEVRRVTSTSVLGQSVERLYREQPALRAVVSFLADNVSSLPLKVYERAGDADRPRVTDCDAALLLARPNPGTTPQQLMSGTVYDLLLYGSALWYVSASADSASGWELTRIPWSWVNDQLTENGFTPSSFKVQNPDSGRAEVEVPAGSCVLFRTYDPMGPMHATSPIEALKQVLSEQISAWEFRNGVWKNGGRVSQYITRPLGAPDWYENGGAKRFAKSWKSKFSGKEGTDTGGTPLLEDGMELRSTTFNAREAQWQEATRLTREDVAAVYHVNPSLIWHTDGQTYASAKDNARALYADTLAPILNMLENTMNGFLLPMIGADPSLYVEFDLEAKLAGSFEERASVMQSAVGAPWMTRNEARAKLNLPAIEGADELIVPLNVVEGGLASPNDTDPTGGYLHGTPRVKSGHGNRQGPTLKKSLGAPPDDAVKDVSAVLARFAERQSRRVLADIGEDESDDKDGHAGLKDGETPSWWNKDRWDRELADDLTPVFQTWATFRALAALSDLGLPSSVYDVARTAAFVRAMAESRARMFNAVTLAQLIVAVAGMRDGGRGETPEGVFEMAATSRAERSGTSFATSVSAFGTTEAARQAYPTDTDTVRRYKVWHHVPSQSPRSNHVAMDGERVGLDEKFSNGADWPGDDVLGPKDACYCHCQVEVEIEEGDQSNSDRDKRIQSRIDNAEVIHENLYEATPNEVEALVEAINKEESRQWETGFRKSDRSAKSYRRTYGAYVESFSPEGRISVEDFTRLEGKELQLAQWLAKAGHEIEFRNADKNHREGGKTTDVFLDGELWEFKRSASKSVAKMARLITERLDRQGPKFVVDLSVSKTSRKDAVKKIASLLEDEKIEQILMVRGGKAILYKK